MVRWFGEAGSDTDAAIEFLFHIYDENGMFTNQILTNAYLIIHIFVPSIK